MGIRTSLHRAMEIHACGPRVADPPPVAAGGEFHWRDLAAQWLTDPQLDRLDRFAHAVITKAPDHDCDIDGHHVGFTEDYHRLAQMLSDRPGSRHLTIVDVGCSAGIQHAYFPWAKRYIGIDPSPLATVAPPATENATFVVGSFPQVLAREGGHLRIGSQVVDPDQCFAIANMSLLYVRPGRERDQALQAFDRHFRRKFIR
jgi:SAM-dependent methyltransferase